MANTTQNVTVKFTRPKKDTGFISCFITILGAFYIRASIGESKKGNPYVLFPGTIKLDKKDEKGNPVYWENVFSSEEAKEWILGEYKKWKETDDKEEKHNSPYSFLG